MNQIECEQIVSLTWKEIVGWNCGNHVRQVSGGLLDGLKLGQDGRFHDCQVRISVASVDFEAVERRHKKHCLHFGTIHFAIGTKGAAVDRVDSGAL